MNKPLMHVPPAQAEALYDHALREDAYWVKSQNRTDAADWTEITVWDDDEAISDRRLPAILSQGSGK